MGRLTHMGVCIEGFLNAMENEPIEYMEHNGVKLTDAQARAELAHRQSLGHTLITTNDECEGFDPFGGGCPGHEYIEDGTSIAD